MGDEQRGYLLELLLTKLRYSTAGMDEVAGEGLQIIGMSATMSNAAAFASWLDAELYETSFRPVQLRRFVKVGCNPCNSSRLANIICMLKQALCRTIQRDASYQDAHFC